VPRLEINKKMSEILTDWGLDFKSQLSLRMWPDFEHGGFYLDVLGMADDALSSDETLPSAIGALIIYQQIAEEVLRAIDYWCYYERKIEAYPAQIQYEIPERLMFGQLIRRLDDGSYFPEKVSIIAASDKLNKACRIPVAHKLLYHDTLLNCRKLAKSAKDATSEIIDCLNRFQDEMFARFSQLAESKGIPNGRPNT
jgi:hypothetical protein